MTVADGSIRNLSAGFSGSLGHDEPIAEEKSILESAEIGMQSTLLRFTGDRSEPLHFDTATVSQFNTNAKHSAWVWLGSSSDKPPALFYAGKLGDAPKTLDTPNLLPGEWTEVAFAAPYPGRAMLSRSKACCICLRRLRNRAKFR